MTRFIIPAIAILAMMSLADAQPMVPSGGGGGGGGSSTITANSTATSGCVAGAVLNSDGSLVQCSKTLPTGLTIPGFAPLASPTFTGTVTTAQITSSLSSITTPTYSSTADATSGVSPRLTEVDIIISGTRTAIWLNTGAYNFGNVGWISFGSTFGTGSTDSTISRKGAGVVQIGTTTTNDSGTLDAAAYQVGGSAGASCTLTTVSHLTVVNGIVTLCN